MLTIRLQRVGKTKKPTYRLIISEKARDTQDRYLELLGSYNPHDKANGVALKAERINYWLGQGAQTSDTVNNLLVKQGIVKGKAVRAVFLSDKRKKKIEEKKATVAAAKAKATVAAEAPAPVAEVAPEAVATEAAV